MSTMNNTYKHSGTGGDLIYSLPIVKHTGGGKLYLHLNQINWIGQHYYNCPPAPIHQGRMTLEDVEFFKPLMLEQDYISEFAAFDPESHEITHNLDRFRTFFMKPGNYVDTYCDTFGFSDPEIKKQLRQTPWLKVKNPKVIPGKDIVINRTSRWLPPAISPIWREWRLDGFENRAIFIGLESEYDAFKKNIGWVIDYQPCKNALEIAEYIAGAGNFIGNQSLALSIAIGLGVEYWCEARRDMPIEQNECYFPFQPRGRYF